jgi:hypothetical protein
VLEAEQLDGVHSLVVDDLLERGGVLVDVDIGDEDQIAEDVPVGTDENPGARGIDLLDVLAELMQEAQGEPLAHIGQMR